MISSTLIIIILNFLIKFSFHFLLHFQFLILLKNNEIKVKKIISQILIFIVTIYFQNTCNFSNLLNTINKLFYCIFHIIYKEYLNILCLCFSSSIVHINNDINSLASHVLNKLFRGNTYICNILITYLKKLKLFLFKSNSNK